MKTQGIMSPVQNGQVVKKTGNAKQNSPNTSDYDFMSVMNDVSIGDLVTGSDTSKDRSASSKKSDVSAKTTTTVSYTKREVSVSQSYKNDTSKQVTDITKKQPSTNSTKGTKDTAAEKNTAKDDKSTKVTDQSSQKTNSADDKVTKNTKDAKTKAEDKNTKAAGPETEDDEVERTEAGRDLISDILNTISKDLGVSEDDITDAMNTLGLSFSDLSTPSNVAQLFMTLTGEDQGSLLTSDEFTGLLDDMNELFSGASDDVLAELTPVTDDEAETLSDVISQASDDAVNTKSDESSQMDVTVVSVTTEETALATQTVTTVSDQTAVSVDDTSDQTQQINGQIVDQTQKQNTSDEGAQQNSSDLFGSTGQKSQTEDVNVNTLASAGTARQTDETSFESAMSAVQKYTDINTDDLISQIVDKARQTLSSRVKSLELELHPQSLGKIFLQVTEKSGDVTAHLYAQNEAVKHALENRLADLQENLNRQGIRVNEVSISVEPHAFEENLEKNMAGQFGNTPEGQTQAGDLEDDKSSQRDGSRSSIDLRDGTPVDTLSDDEIVEAAVMKDSGNTVSYRV